MATATKKAGNTANNKSTNKKTPAKKAANVKSANAKTPAKLVERSKRTEADGFEAKINDDQNRKIGFAGSEKHTGENGKIFRCERQ